MKLPALVLLAAFAAGMAGCCRRAAAPQFAERSLDTVVRCGAVPCDLSYRFLTIANADRSEALAAIENANVNYFFALEDFTGRPRRPHAVLSNGSPPTMPAIRSTCPTCAIRSASRPLRRRSIRSRSTRSAARAIRAVRTVCARPSTTTMDEGRLRTLARRPLSGGAASPAHRADQGEAPRAVRCRR